MHEIHSVFEPLAGRSVWDVQVPGFVDRDEAVPRFMPLAATVYLALGEGYFRLDSVGNYGQLAMSLVTETEPPPALQGEDEEFTLASCGDSFFADSYSEYRITRIRYALNNESVPGGGTVRCAEFEFENRFVVFADPMYHFGIRLQGVGAYDRWVKDSRDESAAFGPTREGIWVPAKTT
ncbi:hypothetical protein ACH4TV_37500 [Streptomyces sp. NPDC020898]|uniref:Uncharacterized protein n=1 Tax=Streptomyces sp. SID12501 TaxID=2706042 RepID=A0A6B3C7D7_9ACTN|nr:hypothetical protein [Streptomyces sp. SID12501]NEC92366.1 hypothetical protein [Streptomyces sp. SID12501]